MSIISRRPSGWYERDAGGSAEDLEPTPAELAAIEAEWPLIEAELALLDAEIAALSAAGGPSPLDWRRVGRAEAHVTRVAARLAADAAARKGAA
ncbi:DUF6284 family protein [Actinopolymorpha sp. B9G3]|uniref:DUF6284 family protein n=1 Tax=Actinopolymorpha sp. B9G3 TaxID=3158970 RepID=UPI0032D9452A